MFRRSGQKSIAPTCSFPNTLWARKSSLGEVHGQAEAESVCACRRWGARRGRQAEEGEEGEAAVVQARGSRRGGLVHEPGVFRISLLVRWMGSARKRDVSVGSNPAVKVARNTPLPMMCMIKICQNSIVLQRLPKKTSSRILRPQNRPP